MKDLGYKKRPRDRAVKNTKEHYLGYLQKQGAEKLSIVV